MGPRDDLSTLTEEVRKYNGRVDEQLRSLANVPSLLETITNRMKSFAERLARTEVVATRADSKIHRRENGDDSILGRLASDQKSIQSLQEIFAKTETSVRNIDRKIDDFIGDVNPILEEYRERRETKKVVKRNWLSNMFTKGTIAAVSLTAGVLLMVLTTPRVRPDSEPVLAAPATVEMSPEVISLLEFVKQQKQQKEQENSADTQSVGVRRAKRTVKQKPGPLGRNQWADTMMPYIDRTAAP